MANDAYYAANKDKVKARSATYAALHPERCKDYKRKYYQLNKQRAKARAKAWAQTNPDARKAARVRWATENKAAAIAATRTWQKSHKSAVNATMRRYQIRHPGEVNYRNRMRELTQKRATPSWLSDNDKLKIKNLYIEAARISNETGVKHHVDHIYPLRGKTCCGLHVPWNLQILVGSVNLSKHNKLPPTGGSYDYQGLRLRGFQGRSNDEPVLHRGHTHRQPGLPGEGI